jgi:hypothetical protein
MVAKVLWETSVDNCKHLRAALLLADGLGGENLRSEDGRDRVRGG